MAEALPSKVTLRVCSKLEKRSFECGNGGRVQGCIDALAVYTDTVLEDAEACVEVPDCEDLYPCIRRALPM